MRGAGVDTVRPLGKNLNELEVFQEGTVVVGAHERHDDRAARGVGMEPVGAEEIKHALPCD